MEPSRPTDPAAQAGLPLGLRERKKAKTRAAIQRHALRLFRRQGYTATTVEQIAAAAEVSPSTFFRYFPTKEDVVLWDPTDLLVLAAIERQGDDLTPVEAVRRAMREAYAQLSPRQLEEERRRQELIRSTPELRLGALNLFAASIVYVCGLVAGRTGRAVDDPAVRTYSGVLLGAIIGAYLAFEGEDLPEMIDVIDKTLLQLENGLTI
jgi:AcrR family transcriptional regulator